MIKNKFQTIKRRTSPFLLSLLLIFAAVIPFIDSNLAHACTTYCQVTSRSITMSTSATGAAATYAVSFTTATTSNIQGMIVDFCSNDPIIGDSCTAPTSFTVGTPTLSPNVTCSTACAAGTWVAGSLNAGRTLDITNSSANTINSGVTVSFTITTVTNPSGSPATFYARILTYASAAGATGYLAATPANGAAIVDAGGIAMATVSQINITARVQEQLTFCMYESATTSGSSATTGDGGNCSGTGSSVTLGNTNGVLAATGPYVDVGTHYDIQTNALHGATIVFKGAPLTSGSDTIEASSVSGTDASTATAHDASTSGSPQFGMCTYAVSGTTANLTAAASGTYSGGTCSSTTQTSTFASTGGAGTAQFGFNITNAAGASGDTLANFPNPGSYATGVIAFIGNISYTTVAGIYTTTLTFIATSTY